MKCQETQKRTVRSYQAGGGQQRRNDHHDWPSAPGQSLLVARNASAHFSSSVPTSSGAFSNERITQCAQVTQVLREGLWN